jgi:RNA polymerase sigma factor (sigma-70 family)
MSPLNLSLRFLQSQPDERLVAMARDGHERAFEALVRRYRTALLAYCRRLAPRGTSPEDILQQALFQAWKALSGGSEVRDPRAWLYRIVHNVGISTLRAAGELPEGFFPVAGEVAVDQQVEQKLAAREALAGLAALPELQRQVMVSTALDGASHEEIASALGISSGSVRGLIYRARASLRAAAAAVIPAPMIDWALRQPYKGGRSAAIYEAVAGGGTAGIAGAGSSGLIGGGSAGLSALVLKGGALLAAGAIAGATAIVVDHQAHHPGSHAGPATDAAVLVQPSGGGLAASNSNAIEIGQPGSRASLGGDPNGSAASQTGRRDGSGDGRSRGDGHHDGSGDGGSGRGSSGSGDGSRGGPDGGSGSTGGDGGSRGGDGGATTAAIGTDGGGSGGSSGSGDGSSSGSSDGGSSGGSSGSGSSDGGSTGTTTSSGTSTTNSSDGGTSTSGSSDGGSGSGSSDGGSLTTTTSGGH